MSTRFTIKAGLAFYAVLVEDEKTGEMGVGVYKNSVDDISFLSALSKASDELLKKLEKRKQDEDLETVHEQGKEPEEKKEEQPTYYSGAVEVAKGDNVLFPTGLKFKVTQGKISYFSGDLAKDAIALVMFSSFTLKSFKELSELLNKIHIKVKEVKEGKE